MPPPPLLDELVEEVLLRVPPDDPARLLRAALVCKRWCRIISDPGFRRRFREFHRTPPMLGFFSDLRSSTFISTTSFRPPRGYRRNYPPIDARHGRVLLHSVPWHFVKNPLDHAFLVWDPITGELRKLPLLPWSFYPYSWNAAVLCASLGACDHLDCRRGPFLVVLVGTDQWGMFSFVYSSEAAAWSEWASAQHPGDDFVLRPSLLLGNALYFVLRYSRSIVKYDLGAREMSLIGMPAECVLDGNVLMATEGGGLGIASLVNHLHRLCLWSREAASDKDAGWVQSRAIDLKTLLPNEALSMYLNVAGFAYGVGVIFLKTDVGIFTIDLRSCQVKKVFKDGWCNYNLPYMSFYTPALAACTEGPRTCTSIA
ncbi:hypothetical protein BS78_02G010800 [Paspalum vaginatum]|nr:hypothetical protein BS78_02G010800 [Paspalum vaginatum]